MPSAAVVIGALRVNGIFHQNPLFHRSVRVTKSNKCFATVVLESDKHTLPTTVKMHSFCFTFTFSDNAIVKSRNEVLEIQTFNPIALRKAKIVCNFGLSECNRVKGYELQNPEAYCTPRNIQSFI